MPTKREIELESRETMKNLVDLILLMDTKIDMILEQINAKQDSKSVKKRVKIQD
jgi:hypothetical protein